MTREVRIEKVDGMYGEQCVWLNLKRLSKDDILITQGWQSGNMKSEVNSIIHQYDLATVFYIFSHIKNNSSEDEVLNKILASDVYDYIDLTECGEDSDYYYVCIGNKGWDYIMVTSTSELNGEKKPSRSFVRREVLSTFRFIIQYMNVNEFKEVEFLIAEGF